MDAEMLVLSDIDSVLSACLLWMQWVYTLVNATHKFVVVKCYKPRFIPYLYFQVNKL